MGQKEEEVTMHLPFFSGCKRVDHAGSERRAEERRGKQTQRERTREGKPEAIEATVSCH